MGPPAALTETSKIPDGRGIIMSGMLAKEKYDVKELPMVGLWWLCPGIP